MERIEIVAPVGKMAALKSVIEAGANVIYVGLKGYSSRPSFADLSLEEIASAVQIAHQCRVKLYVALNSCVSNHMTEKLLEQAYLLDKMQIDALIIADYGILNRLKGTLINASLHASTLLGVYNTETVKLLSDWNIKRVVLSSDLFLEEIAEIISNNPEMEYEMIAAGGICFQCNRQCELPHGMRNHEYYVACQQKFDLYKGEQYVKNGYKIGAPQICLYANLGTYIAMGIKSFKIEGRTNGTETICRRVRELKSGMEYFEAHRKEAAGYVHYVSRYLEGKNEKICRSNRIQ